MNTSRQNYVYSSSYLFKLKDKFKFLFFICIVSNKSLDLCKLSHLHKSTFLWNTEREKCTQKITESLILNFSSASETSREKSSRVYISKIKVKPRSLIFSNFHFLNYYYCRRRGIRSRRKLSNEYHIFFSDNRWDKNTGRYARFMRMLYRVPELFAGGCKDSCCTFHERLSRARQTRWAAFSRRPRNDSPFHALVSPEDRWQP